MDSLTWVKMMAWDLGANYSLELFRRDLVEKVGAERAAQLMPPYPADAPTIMGAALGTDAPSHDARDPGAPSSVTPSSSTNNVAPSAEPAAATATMATTGVIPAWSGLFRQALATGHPAVTEFLLNGARTEALGSNNWVVDGTMTASGKPILANDPHLSTHIPSLWYLAHMSAGAFDVIGGSFPGAPAIAIGRNSHIAWGETNVAADVEDFYLEKLDADGKAVEFQGRFEPLQIIHEEIKVKGRGPVMVDVRVTRHGPLVSDALNVMNAGSSLPPLAFRWTALDGDDSTVEAFLKLNEAKNWDEFVEAMRLFITPSQNFVYADTEGHIGYFLPGRIPIRQAGDGLTPSPGWTGDHEWTGFVPFDALLRAFDPPSHMIVTANHRPNPQDDPLMIALEYPEPYRAEQITALLRGRRGLTASDIQKVQADVYSRHAATLLPLLLKTVDATTASSDVPQALAILREWKYNADRDSAAPAIFEAWFLALAPAIVGDDLGPRLLDSYEGRYSFVTRFISHTLTSNDEAWCDDSRTPVKESCRAVVTTALQQGLAALTQSMGADMKSWKWGTVHPAVFPHQGLDAVAQLRPILNRSIANGGDWSTVDVGAVAADHKYEQRAIPGYRQIVDLSSGNDSRFQDSVGQSGHFLSPHYDDGIEPWQRVEHKPMRMDRARIDSGAIGTLRLKANQPE